MARRSDHSREELREMAIAAANSMATAQGLRGVTARGVARRIGYTVGTIYNIFEDLDDLIHHMNARTLDGLYDQVTATPISEDPVEALRQLASRYLAFVREQPRVWAAVIEFEPQDGSPSPDWYLEKVQRLVGLAENAIAGFFGPEEAPLRRRNATVLWGALYGITSLAQTGSLPDEEEPDPLIDTLIEIYIGGLTETQDTSSSSPG